MTPECNAESFLFQGLGRREVAARFDGGTITSDAGALLLWETERITGIVRQSAACFTDHRRPHRISGRRPPTRVCPARPGPRPRPDPSTDEKCGRTPR